MSVRVLIVGRDEALRCIAWEVIVAVHCGKLQQIGRLCHRQYTVHLLEDGKDVIGVYRAMQRVG